MSARDTQLAQDEVESKPLTGGARTSYLGIPMEMDSANWHWMMVFPLIDGTDEKSKAEWDKEIPGKEAAEIIMALLTDQTVKGFPDNVDGYVKFNETTHKREAIESAAPITKRELHKKIREKIVQVLSSKRNGFNMKVSHSIDGDEAFLLIELKNSDAKVALAARQEMRIAVIPEAYEYTNPAPQGQTKCPTLSYEGGFSDKAKQCPMYLRFDKSIYEESIDAGKPVYKDISEVQTIRIVRKRMRQFFSLNALEANGVVTVQGPVHKHEMLDYFWNTAWTQAYTCGGILQFPNARHIDDVRDYFGEEVAFFFHWFNTYTRWLALPAILGFFCFFRRVYFELVTQRYIQMGFAVFMMMWSTVFVASYKQRESLKCHQWGVKNFASVASVRKEYSLANKNTKSELFLRTLHWILAVMFMFETVYCVYCINSFRQRALQLEVGDTMYGMSGKTANKLGVYMVTVNIKIVDFVWNTISPKWSTKFDNWRTDGELKAAKISRMFPVKFIIYYYPFFYYAFMQEPIEGCEPLATSCIDTLVLNLAIFFGTHIACVIAFTVIPLITMFVKIKLELRNKPGKVYTYLQAQAKMDPYIDDTDDFMELVLSCGFLMMFSVALPVMATLAFMCNLLELRLLAFKIMYVSRRPVPLGQEGIGAWSQILEIIATAAVVVNTGMAIFSMLPLKSQPLQVKLLLFIMAEHAMLVITGIIAKRIPLATLAEANIMDVNDGCVDDVLGDASAPVTATNCLLNIPQDIMLELQFDADGMVTSVSDTFKALVDTGARENAQGLKDTHTNFELFKIQAGWKAVKMQKEKGFNKEKYDQWAKADQDDPGIPNDVKIMLEFPNPSPVEKGGLNLSLTPSA